MWEVYDWIESESVYWVWPRLGIKGMRCSHSDIWGWVEEGVLWHRRSTHGSKETSEGMVQVTVFVPHALSYTCVDSTHTHVHTVVTIYTCVHVFNYMKYKNRNIGVSVQVKVYMYHTPFAPHTHDIVGRVNDNILFVLVNFRGKVITCV